MQPGGLQQAQTIEPLLQTSDRQDTTELTWLHMSEFPRLPTLSKELLMLQYLLLRQPKYRRVAVLSPQACLVRTMNLVAFMAKQSQVIRHFRGSCAPRVLRVLQCTFHSVMWPLGALIKHVPTRATNHVVRPFENVPKICARAVLFDMAHLSGVHDGSDTTSLQRL